VVENRAAPERRGATAITGQQKAAAGSTGRGVGNNDEGSSYRISPSRVPWPIK
jgi:hypothetical protein